MMLYISLLMKALVKIWLPVLHGCVITREIEYTFKQCTL